MRVSLKYKQNVNQTIENRVLGPMGALRDVTPCDVYANKARMSQYSCSGNIHVVGRSAIQGFRSYDYDYVDYGFFSRSQDTQRHKDRIHNHKHKKMVDHFL